MRRDAVRTARLTTTILLGALLTMMTPVAVAQTAEVSPDERIERHFDFTSARLVNLHHFLLQQAALDPSLPQRGRRPMKPRHPLVDTSTWTEGEQKAWDAALTYYRDHLVGRSTLFDRRMRSIRDALSGAVSRPIAIASPVAESSSDLAPLSKDLASFDAIDDKLARVLEGADAVYRKRLWPQHDARNRAWVAAIRPRLRTVIAEFPQRLVEVYGVEWPMDPNPIRVDVSVDADWAGAYTTLEPPHVCLSSTDARHEGWLAIEILFHEASHILVSEVSREIREACGERSMEVPRDLWHVVLFYTTGELVRPYAGESFEAYADANGLYERVPEWGRYRDAIVVEWQPYLDGKIERIEAVAKLVERLREK